MSSSIIQIRKKGTVTLPVELRKKYQLNEGDVFTLIDLGESSFLLTPHMPQVAKHGDLVAEILEGEGISLEQILDTLDEEREQYYRDHYVEE